MKKPTPQHPIDATVQQRLVCLERLIDDEYEGKPKVFEEKTGIRMAQVGQWFTGYRALRDKALKRLEEQTKKPAGWFDGMGGKTPSPAPPPAAASLAETLAQLGQVIAASDKLTRAQIKPILDQLLETPEQAAELGARLQATIAMQQGRPTPLLPGVETKDIIKKKIPS